MATALPPDRNSPDEEQGMTTTEDPQRFRRSNRFYHDAGRLSVWEVLGIVTTFRQNVERLKLYKATLTVIRFFAVLNFIYSVVGVAFVIIGFTPKVYEALEIQPNQSTQFLKLGVCVCLFAPLSLGCDLLALRGLRTWRKALLLPWLVVYSILVALLMAVVLTCTFNRGFHWRFLLLGASCFCLFLAWRRVRLQYAAMILPKPTCCTVEDLATDLRAREHADVISEPLPNDLPPKYDDLEQPPKYEEHVQPNQDQGGNK